MDLPGAKPGDELAALKVGIECEGVRESSQLCPPSRFVRDATFRSSLALRLRDPDDNSLMTVSSLTRLLPASRPP